tara:strand:- start:26 stop:880 length:855 start_codon:yes stop_codon:yes gene_type:complete
MPRIFKHRGVWYLDICINQQRIRKSLHTQSKKIALKVSKTLEYQIIQDSMRVSLSIHNMIKMFLEDNHPWSASTYDIYRTKLRGYLKDGYPQNPSSKAMTIRCLNKMYRWAHQHGYMSHLKKIKGGGAWENRMRTFNQYEMQKILNDIKPQKFQEFVRFAYYTGARRGEIASLTDDNIKYQYVVGKSGKRPLKLNLQAKEVLLGTDSLWTYSPGYITQTFKKNLRRLEIKNGRFHDLRRTFGLNLIKQGMPIYEVSKLLGHASVKTTEKHYAPLLVTEIKDFVL